MDRSTHKSRGQAVIEATISATALLLVITVASGAALSFRETIKHDSLSTSDPESHSAAAPSEGSNGGGDTAGSINLSMSGDGVLVEGGSDNFKGKLVVSRDKDGKLSLSQLELEGWVKQQSVDSGGHLLMILSRDNEELVTDGKTGVISCVKDCAN
jgi:hypothetical protein